MTVVPRTLDELRIVRYALPRLAPVFRAVEAPVLGLDDRPDATILGGGDGDAHASLDALWKPLFAADVLPGVTAVGGAVDRAAGPAGGKIPRFSTGLPECGEHDTRIVRVHRQICGAGRLIPEKHALPRFAAVGRAEDSTFRAVAEDIAQCGDIYHVWIRGMNPNARDVLGGLQAHVRPASSPVRGAVDPVSGGYVASRAGLARAREYHGRVGRRYGDCPDGGRRKVAVRDIPPIRAAVVRLPHSPGTGPEIEGRLLRWMAGNRDDSAAAVWPDVAPSEGAKKGRIDGGGGCHVFFPRLGRYYTNCARTRQVFSQMVRLTSTARRSTTR